MTMSDPAPRLDPDPDQDADMSRSSAAGGQPADREMVVPSTRTGFTLVATVLGLVLALLMLVFVLQNGERQSYEFLWLDFTLPSGVAMLVAAIAGGLVVALIGIGRIAQIRLAARRHRRADRRSHT
jgi:uncharacterized integral membrane protein